MSDKLALLAGRGLVTRDVALPLCLAVSACGGDGTFVASLPPPPQTPTPTPTPTPATSVPTGTVVYTYPATNPVVVRTSWLDSPAARLGNYDLIARLTMGTAGKDDSISHRQAAVGEFSMSVGTSSNGGLDYVLKAPAGFLPAGMTTSTVGSPQISWDINSTVAYRYTNTYGDMPQYLGQRLAGFAKLADGSEAQLFSYDYTRGNSGFGRVLDAATYARTTLDYDIGYSYVSMGEWFWGVADNVTGDLVPGTNYGMLLFVDGDRTPSTGIPLSGTATYDARTLFDWLKVPFSLVADFSQRSISTRIDQDYRYDPAGDIMDYPLAFGIHVGGSAPFSNSGSFDIPLTGTVNWASSYAINTAQAPPADEVTGSMNGAFFGPHAEQVGGTFSLQRTGGSQIFEDAFVGRQHETAAAVMKRPYFVRLLLACTLGSAGTSVSAASRSDSSEYLSIDPMIEREFLDGMAQYLARDYRSAEASFRRILDRDPSLLRVRLELARTLFMEKRDEQADYQFRLASAAHPPAMVARNIVRFREAIRARRSWRFNFSFGLAPDSNINAATDRETVDIYGLPFHLDPTARARSGTGTFVGGDASVRFNRFGKVPVYVGVYGQWLLYRDHRFDDVYVGGSVGPEFGVAGGRLRMTATGVQRWFGNRALVASIGTHLAFEKLIGRRSTLGAAVLVRHNDYAGRNDVDGWAVEARASVDRPLGPTTLGFANVGVERDLANDPGQAFWRVRVGFGFLKEIGWGLRPQLSLNVAREVNDGLLAPFGKTRRDWLLEGNVSIYKRDWNVNGFAPSLSLTLTRNRSTLSLYEQKRVRGELRLTKAF